MSICIQISDRNFTLVAWNQAQPTLILCHAMVLKSTSGQYNEEIGQGNLLSKVEKVKRIIMKWVIVTVINLQFFYEDDVL